jgi:ubiquinone/menaquinone biosynthesis C-methylase UbiE
MSLVDFGCGSGRLASILGRSMKVDFRGIDIVQSLLDYAKTKTPKNYRFLLHRELNIPAPTNQTDVVSAFSVFMHLLRAETYIYLEDIKRILKKAENWSSHFWNFPSKRTVPFLKPPLMLKRTILTCPSTCLSSARR